LNSLFHVAKYLPSYGRADAKSDVLGSLYMYDMEIQEGQGKAGGAG
jgi:hypothetical protein